MSVRILTGDCREILAALPDESVHCVVTSPPYWSLRDYGVPPSIWGGDVNCTHHWGSPERTAWANSVPGPSPNRPKNGGGYSCDRKETGPFCIGCGAWRGAHGLEPTLNLFVVNEVAIFREVRRVLRDDGTLWLNLGDSYATGTSSGRKPTTAGKHGYWENPSIAYRINGAGDGLKPKDLCGIPWRVAFALQADGWYLRQDIIWSKPNPMPESVRDRCTKAHEYLFLLAKSETYYYDAEAIKEPATENAHSRGNGINPKCTEADSGIKQNSSFSAAVTDLVSERNKRSVWEVATAPFPEAHFATFPPAIIEPCIKAGTSERGCCTHCGTGWERVTGKVETGKTQKMPDGMATYAGGHTTIHKDGREQGATGNPVTATVTLGWYPGCGCDDLPALPPYPEKPSRAQLEDEDAYKAAMVEWRCACVPIDRERQALCEKANSIRIVPATVLDPFGGAGTTGLVADRLQRSAVLIELNPEYAAMARRRIDDDAPLFAGAADG